MAAGRIVVSEYTPARDRNDALVAGAKLYVYTNGTTTLASIYTSSTLLTALANPVVANSSGQFAQVWADNTLTYSVSVTGPNGESIGNPSTFDDYSPSTNFAVSEVEEFKAPVRVASTASITIASALINGSTIDGVVVATGDRVLLKDQSTASQNGIYVVVATGAASRSGDADTSAKVTSGMTMFVSEGTASAGAEFSLTTANTITLGTTALTFSRYSGILPVANGGTGSATAAAARTALGSTTVGDAVFIAASAAAARTAIGTVIGTDVQAYDVDLGAIAALTSAADKMPYSTGAQTWALTDLTTFARTLLATASNSAFLTALGQIAGTFVNFLQSGTSASTRTMQDKARESVSVKDYGATGDGVSRALSTVYASLAAAQVVYPFATALTQTFDWAGIRAALAASQAVYVPAGTYMCGATEIIITRPTQLRGDGPNVSILSFSSSTNGLNFQMASAVKSASWNNCLDGIGLINSLADGTATTGAGLRCSLAYFSEFTNFTITNFYDGISVLQSPVSNFRGFQVTTYVRYGFASTAGNNFDCRVEDFVISGQKVIASLPTVFGLYGIYLSDMNDEFLFQNGIVNYNTIGLYTTATTYAINQCPEFGRFINISFDSNQGGVDLASCTDMVFTSCFFSNRPNSGAIIGQRATTRNVQFFGCTFQSNGNTGVTMFSGALYTNFNGCNFQSNSVSAGVGISHGVVVQTGTTDFAFINCHFGNTWGSGTQNFGLYITDATNNRFVVIGNSFATSGGTFINSATGADQNIADNTGFETIFTGSAVYDPASLVDGAGATTTVTVTGAALGDYVRGVSFSLDLQGITLTGWVSAANTVSVRLQNETGGTIDLLSGTLRAKVEDF